MLTLRSFLMTSAGLLTGFAAAAQTAPAAGPQPTDVLTWVTWWLAGVVLLMAIINGASATSAAARSYQETAKDQEAVLAAPAVAVSAVAQAEAAAPAVQPAAAPVFALAAAEEAIAA